MPISVSVDAGTRHIACGRAATPVVPPWVDGMTLDTWYAVSGASPGLSLDATNDCEDVAQADPLGGRNFEQIMHAWNGGVWASGLGPSGSLLIWGGGHGDYPGTDIYRWDAYTRFWSRHRDTITSGWRSDPVNGEEVDGAPCAIHTRDLIGYDDERHRAVQMASVPAFTSESSSMFSLPHILDVDAAEWSRGTDVDKAKTYVKYLSGICWDPTRKKWWIVQAATTSAALGHGSYSPSLDAWADEYNRDNDIHANRAKLAMSVEHDMVVGFKIGSPATIAAMDAGNPAGLYSPITTSGTAPTGQDDGGWSYGAATGACYYSPRDAGNSIYKLTLPSPAAFATMATATWPWSTITHSGRPVADTIGATPPSLYGRFQVVTWGDTDLALSVSRTSAPVYAMRLS